MTPGEVRFVDVADPATQVELDRHPLVRSALDHSPLGTLENPAHLDEAIIRLGVPVGRPITQAVSRAVFEETNAGGLRYTSRLDVREDLWAIFDTVEVVIEEMARVDLDDPDLAAAAGLLRVRLPTTPSTTA